MGDGCCEGKCVHPKLLLAVDLVIRAWWSGKVKMSVAEKREGVSAAREVYKLCSNEVESLENSM